MPTVAELMSHKDKKLSQLVAERIALFPSSGEINSTLDHPQAAIDRILAIYEKDAVAVDHTDGISLDMEQWRFNLRLSNTEPVVRLNVESRGSVALMKEKTSELLHLLRQ